MDLKTVSTPHVPVQYLEGGSGEPLVFLHGAGGMQPNDPFLEALARSFHVYAPFVPGYGDSEECPEIRDMLDFTLHHWDVVAALGLYLLLERTRLGAMIRAGVDDMQMARAVGIPVSSLFTAVFCLGAGIAGAGGVLGGPILSAYPGLDADMLPLALIVVILGGVGSLVGAFVGSFVIGLIYTFGTALFPDLAYVILFLPMIVVIAYRPQGLFGRLTT